MDHKISVIVPVFNVQDYLPQCLYSLDIQTGVNMEVILVNDGSTDDSLSVCKEYAQRNPDVVVIDKENGGLSDARNVGTKAATGDYIYYLDSDDWLAPDAIKTLYDYAIEEDCEIVQGGFYYAYEDHLLYDNKYKKTFVWERHEVMLELIKNDFVKDFAWGKLYRADIVKKYDFPKGKYYEDSFWQHLVVHECSRYGVIPIPLYYYRQRSTGISGEFSLKNLDLLLGYEARWEFIQNRYPEYTKQMATILWNQGYSLIEMAENSKDELVRNSFRKYWMDLNQRNSYLFNTLIHDLRYTIVRHWPSLMPVYTLYNKMVCKFSLHDRYVRTVNENN